MKVKLTLEMRPRTRPGILSTRVYECTHITRNYEPYPNAKQKWCILHHPKGNWQIDEAVIKNLEMEDF